MTVALVLYLSESGLALSREIIVSGESLSRPVEHVISFSIENDFVIGASQYYADYTLSLKEQSSGEIIRQVDASADKGFDEIMVVSSSDCQVCLIELKGVEYIDTQSKFELWSEPLSNFAKDELDQISIKAFLQDYTKAAELFFNSNGVETASGKKSVEQANAILEKISALDIHESLEPYQLNALDLLAYAYDHSGDSASFERTLSLILEKTDDSSSVARGYALYDIATLANSHAQQLTIYDEALSIASQQKDQRLLAKVFNRKAIRLVQMGRMSEAIDLLLKAREINKVDGRLRPLIKNIGNLSWANQRSNDLVKALKYAAEQKLVAERFRRDDDVLWSLYYLGIAYGKLGERSTANQFLNEALRRALQRDANQTSSLGALVGYIYQEMANRLLEYEKFDYATEMASAMRSSFLSLGDQGRVAVADSIIGEIALYSGDIALAREKLDSAIAFYASNNRQRELGNRYFKYALLEIADNNLLEASENVNQALKILSQTEDRYSLAQSLSLSIDIVRQLGSPTQAGAISDKARKTILEELEGPELAEYWYRDSLVKLALSQPELALQSLSMARSHIEATLPKIKRPDLRRIYLALQKRIFEKSVDSLIEYAPDGVEKALLLVESFKARTLEDRLSVDMSLVRKSESQIVERNRIHQKLLSNALSVHSKVMPGDISVLQVSQRLSESLESLEQEVLIQRTRSRESQPSTNLHRQSIKDTELVGVYFTGEDNSWLWEVTKNNTSVYRLPPRADIDDLVEKFISNYSLPPTSRKNVSDIQQLKIVENLAAAVLSPLKNSLQSGHYKELSIIPDGSLFSIPFSALRIESSTEPLVSLISISYSHSLTSKWLLKDRVVNHRRGDKKALVFANAGFDENPESSFGVIPYSEIEADYISQTLGSYAEIYKGLSANKAKLNQKLEQEYQVIHLATHGLLNNQVSALSGLSFPSSNGETSLWLLPEISNSQIRAELIFLSACETSNGKLIPGEGLIGLSRAFLEAGAKNVIGTLWSVQDKVTSELVRNFYYAYKDPKFSYERALQYAQRQVFENSEHDWSDPYYWSGFQLVGEG